MGDAAGSVGYIEDERSMRRLMRQVELQRAILRHPYAVTLTSSEARWLCDHLLTPARLESTSDTGYWLRLLKQQLDDALARATVTDAAGQVLLIIPRYCVEQISYLQYYAYVPGLPATLVEPDGIEDVLQVTGNPASPQAFEHESDVMMAQRLARLMSSRGEHGRVAPFEVPLAVDDVEIVRITASETIPEDLMKVVYALMSEQEAIDVALMDEVEAARTVLAKLGSAFICNNWPDEAVERIIASNP